jgi:hypothetical protein
MPSGRKSLDGLRPGLQFEDGAILTLHPRWITVELALLAIAGLPVLQSMR